MLAPIAPGASARSSAVNSSAISPPGSGLSTAGITAASSTSTSSWSQYAPPAASADSAATVTAPRELTSAAGVTLPRSPRTSACSSRFRSVPLGDELANARDLLRAAGLDVEAVIAADADLAPAAALGPVIRETTTNVLRHGRGGRARLALTRTPDAWRYEIANDADAAATADEDGSGLEGVRRRIADVGGTFELHRDDGEFLVAVTVPSSAKAAS